MEVLDLQTDHVYRTDIHAVPTVYAGIFVHDRNVFNGYRIDWTFFFALTAGYTAVFVYLYYHIYHGFEEARYV